MNDPSGLLRRCAPLLAVGAVLLAPSAALAYDYRVPILVDEEQDILELFYSGDITEDERDRLLLLFRSPLELNTASRDDLYNLPGISFEIADRIIAKREDKPFTRVSQLKKIKGINEDIYGQLAPFVRLEPKVGKPGAAPGAVTGKVRAKAGDRIAEGDEDKPEGFVQVEARVPDQRMEAGAVVAVRNTISAPEWKDDPARPVYVWPSDQSGEPKSQEEVAPGDVDDPWTRYLRTDGLAWAPAWPKAYAMAERDSYRVLAGSYRIGFGQRLVIDNTGAQNPYGFAPDIDVYEGYEDFTLYKGFFGAVGTFSGIDLGTLTVEATPFFSWWRYDLYQYDLKHHNSAATGGDEYESYTVLTPYEMGSPCLEPCYRKLSHVTLPAAYSELMGGANVTLRFGKRSHAGITGYASTLDFHLGDPDTVPSRSSPFPQRDVFGAGGLEVGYLELDRVALFGELAMMDNQELAGTARFVAELTPVVLEGSVRYYGDEYDNPHSRGYNMPDEFLGDRDKGELGGLLSVRYSPTRWLTLRVDQDVWRATAFAEGIDPYKTPEEEWTYDRDWRTETFLRVDTRPADRTRVGVFLQRNDKNVDASGRDEKYEDDGEKWQTGIQAAWSVPKKLSLWGYYKISLYDAGLGVADPDKGREAKSGWDGFQKDHYFTLKAAWQALAWLEIVARGKYFKGELETMTGSSREHYLEWYLQATADVTRDLSFGLRGMLVENLTEEEDPLGEKELFWYALPEDREWFWKAQVEYKF